MAWAEAEREDERRAWAAMPWWRRLALKAWGWLLVAAIFALFALPFFGPLLTG